MTGASRLIIGPATRPRLQRHVKLRRDTRRGWILLAPERVFTLGDTGVAILELCDGARTVAAITSELATQYKGETLKIAADVIGTLQELADKGVISA